jgi:hypothetical protein
MATIRFLPVFDPEDENALDWVKLYSHGFQGDNGLWYIENCPTTINESCPLCTMNVKLYKSGPEGEKTARERKRKIQYYTNVYIVSDPSNPEMEGTVKIFRFGVSIFDKIKTAIKPEFADEIPIDPFNMWAEGANFKLKIRKVDDQINYDKSEFTNPSPLFDNDDDIEKVWKKTYPLSEFVSKDKFKSEEELQKRLAKVLDADIQYESKSVAAQTTPKTASKMAEEIEEDFNMGIDTTAIDETELDDVDFEAQFNELLENDK